MFRRTTCEVSGTPMRVPSLEISRYDWAVSLGITLMLMSVFGAVLGITEWFATGLMTDSTPTPPSVEPIRQQSLEPSQMFAVDVAEPAVEDVAADQSVSNEAHDVTRLDDADNVVIDNLLAVSALPLDEGSVNPAVQPAKLPARAEGTGNRPIGTGMGLSPGGDRPRGDNRETRWQIQHSSASSMDEYARRLQSVGIEPAALDPSKQRILFLKNLTAEQPALSEKQDDFEETRMFLTWADGSESLTQADRDLFLRAGFDASESKLLHFLSPEAEEELAALEAEAAMGRDVRSIRRTEFGIQHTTDGFEFFVIRVLFR